MASSGGSGLGAWLRGRAKGPWYLGDAVTLSDKALAGTERKWSLQLGGGAAPPDFGSRWLIGAIEGMKTGQQIKAGDLIDNGAVMACVGWAMRTVSEAPLVVRRVNSKKVKEDIDGHPLTRLLRRPNPYYSGRLLWRATMLSFDLEGNAYWLKSRRGNGKGATAELWYEPHFSIREIPDPVTFIAGYEVWRDGQWIPIPRENVVHFRNGIDPRNTRRGLSPLQAALRNVFSDNEAAIYTASMLHNLGVPPILVSPKSVDSPIADPDAVKQAIMDKTTGEHRGEALVLGDPADVQILSFDPDDMNTRELRKLDEERISAILGVPAIVAGLGAGLDRSTFANMAEAREMAYESKIIPTLALFGDELDSQLLPEFSANVDAESVEFDLSGVRVLQDDMNVLWTRIGAAFEGTRITLNEARTDMGKDPIPGGDVFLLRKGGDATLISDLATFVEEQDAALAEPPPAPMPPMLPPGQQPAQGDQMPMQDGPPQQQKPPQPRKSVSVKADAAQAMMQDGQQPPNKGLDDELEGKANPLYDKPAVRTLEKRIARKVRDYLEDEYDAIAEHITH